MICSIADLTVYIPNVLGMYTRCHDYLYLKHTDSDIEPDICLVGLKDEMDDDFLYLESGFQFYAQLLKFNGLMLHASAVELNGKAYLFSGPCGMGKSTHTRLWQQLFGESAQVFNDDKPALRYLDGKWYAYGTPWCGKDGINQNKKVPLAGICFLRQAEDNKIRQLSQDEAIPRLISQTRRKFWKPESIDLMLQNVEQLVKDIPIFELENKPELAAAQLSYETMRQKAEEMNL